MHSTAIQIAQAINADPSVYMPAERPMPNGTAHQHQLRAGARFDVGGYMMEFGRAAAQYYHKDTRVGESARLAKAVDALLDYLKSYAAEADEPRDIGGLDPRHAWSRYRAVADDTKALAPVLALLDMPGVRFVFTSLYLGAGFAMSSKLARLLSPEEPFVILSSDRRGCNVIQNALEQLGGAGVDLATFFREMAQLAAPEQKKA